MAISHLEEINGDLVVSGCSLTYTCYMYKTFHSNNKNNNVYVLYFQLVDLTAANV